MKFQAIKGVRDILPPESALWNHVDAAARVVFATYGYGEIRLPIFEPTELFARSIGAETDVVAKEMYTFEDRDSASITLRPEATASVVRAYIEHGLYTLPGNVKLYYLGPMFRRERPQKGRYRQFYQIGAELLGTSDHPALDAEVIEMLLAFFARIELKGSTLYLNSIGDKNCRPGYVELLRAELEKVRGQLGPDSQRRIETNPLRVLDSKLPEEQAVIETLPRIAEHLCEDCRAHYAKLKEELALRSVSYQENWRLVRGLDYYMRTTFEITAPGLGSQNAVCGGGRYDGLVELLGGPATTKGIGFAIGADRLMLSLQESGQVVSAGGIEVFLAWFGAATYPAAVALARKLREEGIVVELPAGEMKFGKALNLADRLGARFAVILGEEELAAGKFTVKRLADGEQVKLSEADLSTYLFSGAALMAALDLLGDWKRTHYAGDLRAGDAEKEVLLMGWVHGRRDLGTLIFIDVRDRSGIAQIVFNKELAPAAHARAEELRAEYVVAVRGRVTRRQKANPELSSGEVEVFASELRILNTAKTPPFVVEDEINAGEETRLRYRFLDLRRPRPQRNIALRHRVVLEIRKTMDELGFYEIETPMLTRSTPEGARDYLVPSRVHHGQFYALPQSPQIFKQILMIAGLDRYFQIARCFRDEDLRADRQPEFTQLDVEMSFPRRDDVFGVIEKVMMRACGVAGITVAPPFRRMEYREAIRRYGIDKPDLRFGMELCDVTQQFSPGREKVRLEGSVQALVAPGAAAFSRKQLDKLAEQAKAFGARGLYTVKVAAEGVTSALEKTLGAAGVQAIVEATGAKTGDLIVAVSAAEQIPGTDAAALVAGQLRLALAERLNLVPKDRWEFLWITDFPLFEWGASEKRWAPAQHPFTGIVEEDLGKLESEPQNVRSKGYDLVANGVELGSGSIRIHSQELQGRVFRMLGLSDEQARERFGFFLDALTYGTPPHGGIALGIDRMVALLAGEKSMREVIAFPKTTKAQDLMAEAPSGVEQEQLDELGIVIKPNTLT